MTEFNTFPPTPVVVALSCGSVELTPVRLGELPRLLTAVRPLTGALTDPRLGEPDWFALMGEHGQSVLELLTITTRRERAWIDDLSLQDAVLLAAAVFEVNVDFFVGRVVPAIQGAAERLAPTLQALTPAVSTASPVTGTPPSPA